MASKNKLEPIYSKDYYRMEKMVRDKRFQERVRQLRAEYAKLGHPIPQKGFRTLNRYVNWLKPFGKFYHEQHKAELEKVLPPIKQDKTLTDLGRGIQAVIAERKLLPLLPNPAVENLMEEFGIDKNNEKFFSFIHSHIFRGQEHLDETHVKARLKRNENSELELAIIVLPHTKLQHIKDIWKKVQEYQKFLPGYKGRNKQWETFERDLQIYNIYKDIQSKMTGKRAKKNEFGVDVSTYTQLRDENKQLFSRLTLSEIRKAITRIEDLTTII